MLQRALGLTARAVGTVVGTSVGMATGVVDLVGQVASGVTATAPGRLHVALSGAPPDVERGTWLEEHLGEHDAVARVEVNAVLGHVMVEFDAERLDTAAVRGLVAEAEVRAPGPGSEPGPPPAPHPASPVAVLRETGLLGLQLAGLAASVAGRALPAIPLPGTLLGLVDAAPAARALAAAALGDSATDVLLGTVATVSHATGRRPLGLIADGCLRYSLREEAAARRRAWTSWEQALAAEEGAHRAALVPARSRPVPLPDGPVERVAHGSALAALGGYAAMLASTGAGALSDAVLAAGVPKAARAGREAFAAQLDRDAATRGSLVLDPKALRRLDRVTTVVLEAGVLLSGRPVLDDVVPVSNRVDRSSAVERAHDLVDPHRPERRHSRDGWSVRPLDEPAGSLPARVRGRAAELVERGCTVLALFDRADAADPDGAGTATGRAAGPVALVGVAEGLDPFAEALVEAAARCGTVLVGGADPVLARRVGAHGATPEAADLAAAVRELQAIGQVVALVGTDGAALAAADVGVGAVRTGRPPPWSADVLARGAGEVHLLLDAVTAARQTSRRSAALAAAGSGVGGVLAVLGPAPGAPLRASIPVHTAALLALGLGAWSAISVAGRPEPVPAERTPWHAMSARSVLDALGSSPDGLDDAESRRRHRGAPAARRNEQVGLARASLRELANPLTPVLAGGAGLSASTGSVLDPLLITAVVAMNALIGGVQQQSAARSLRALRHSSAPAVLGRRSGVVVDLRSDELVAGDVVSLQAGDAVPADCRLLRADGVEVDESTLTGESAPVGKSVRATGAPALADRHSMLYEGTVVAAGRCAAVVVATGDGTEAGRTLRAGGERPPPGGVALRMQELTAKVLPFSVGAAVGLVGIDLLRRRPLPVALSRGVGLAVAAVPEGLPFVTTVAELASARRLSARGALVSNPSTIEALGRVDVLCFDKTGTLTEGTVALRGVSDGVSLRSLHDPPGPESRAVVAAAVRAGSPATDPARLHPTDLAVRRAAAELGIEAGHGLPAEPEQLDELPFGSHRGFHATLWRCDTETGTDTGLSVKGAPEVVLPLCRRWRRAEGVVPIDAAALARIHEEIDRLARRGYRVLAVAEGAPGPRSRVRESDVDELTLSGLVVLADPVRRSAAEAVATLRAAGVDIMMITGDHPSTAESIAAKLDLLNGGHVLTGAELDGLDDAQLAAALSEVTVFARVSPAQKARVVRALQDRGSAVAVTGDGTNDVPAIRLADVGLALGVRATPAAREAADVVITDDRIETITDAIVEGRAMWSSVRDALSILLGGNLGEIAYTLGTGLLGGAGALNARQLLLVNLLTDVLPAMAVAVRPPPEVTADKLLAEGPEGSLGASLTRDITRRAAVTATAAGAAWLLARPVSTAGQANTTGLVALVGAQLGQTLAVRGRTPLVLAAVAGSMLVLAAAVQLPGVSHAVGSRPLLAHQWALALAASAAATAVQLLLAHRPGAATGA